MKIYTSINQIQRPPLPCAITLGVFDAIHLGHLKIFKRLNKVSKTSVVVTFKNNPLATLCPKKCPLSIIPLEEKLYLLEKAGIDIVILLSFTKTFSQIPYDVFLNKLHLKLTFSHLVLGKGATFGKDRLGNKHNTTNLANTLSFHLEYLSKVYKEDTLVSSSNIRSAIAKGDLKLAKKLIGRLFGITLKSPKQKNTIKGLCLPPNGIYKAFYIQDSLIVKDHLTIKSQKISLNSEAFSNKKPLYLEFIV